MRDPERERLELTEQQIRELFVAREILNKFFDGRGRATVFTYTRGESSSCTFTCSGSCESCTGSCEGGCDGDCEGGCEGNCKGGCSNVLR
jgi:hypothetical protein